MRASLVVIGILACGCMNSGDAVEPAAEPKPEPVAKAEEVIARHVVAVTAIFKDHTKPPKDGLETLRKYVHDNLPELTAAAAQAIVEIDTLESRSKRTARAKEMLKTLSEPLKALQAAAEEFYARAATDEDARDLISDMEESYGELAESLEALGLTAGRTSCKRAWVMMSKCTGNVDMKKDDFMTFCEQHQGELISQALLDCGKQKGCEDYDTCIKKATEDAAEAGRDKRVKDGIDKLTKQLADKAWRDARATCDALRADVRDGSQEKQRCDGLPRQALAALTADVTALRDQGEADKDFKCVELKDAAEAISEDETAKAKVLCDELGAATKVGPALAGAQKNLQAGVAEVPFDCDFALEQLENVGSDFANRKALDVAKACYVDLGKAVLAAKVPAMEYTCSYQVQKVWDAAKRWSLQDADLAAWLEKAKPLCDKSAAPAPVEPAPALEPGEMDCAKLCQKQIDCARSMGGMNDEAAKQALEGCALGCGMAARSEEASLRKVYRGMAACVDKPCGLEWAQCLGEHMK